MIMDFEYLVFRVEVSDEENFRDLCINVACYEYRKKLFVKIIKFN